jgi:hypothetical protein
MVSRCSSRRTARSTGAGRTRRFAQPPGTPPAGLEDPRASWARCHSGLPLPSKRPSRVVDRTRLHRTRSMRLPAHDRPRAAPASVAEQQRCRHCPLPCRAVAATAPAPLSLSPACRTQPYRCVSAPRAIRVRRVGLLLDDDCSTLRAARDRVPAKGSRRRSQERDGWGRLIVAVVDIHTVGGLAAGSRGPSGRRDGARWSLRSGLARA